MRLHLIILACAGVLCTTSMGIAQEESFEEFLKREKKDFEKFKAESDREFAEFLRKSWEEMEVMKGTGPFRKPKPVAIQPRKISNESPAPVPDATPPVPVPRPKPVDPGIPPVEKKLDRIEEIPASSVEFFGTPVHIPGADRFPVPQPRQINEEGIALAWEEMSAAQFNPVLQKVQDYRKQLRLNDWGYCRLLYATGLSMGGGSPQSAVFFTWFMLNKSGIDARVGYTEDDLFLLLGSEETLFGASFLTMQKTGRRYYVVSLEQAVVPPQKSLYSYDGDAPGDNRLCSFRLLQPPALKEEAVSKTLTFSYRGKVYSIPVALRKDVVRFFEFYPQTDFSVYFSSPASNLATTSLLAGLRPLVEGKGEWEAVNIILRFVQGAFEYKTDQEVFQREKPMFPDETLFYPFSDCEDRAILFSYIVKHVTGLEVIGLDFPGHIATAVRFRGDVNGVSVRYKGKKYIVCDPTYLNADVGECMPNLRMNEMKVIPG